MLLSVISGTQETPVFAAPAKLIFTLPQYSLARCFRSLQRCAILYAVILLVCAARPVEGQTFSVLHTFSGPPDGSVPTGVLIFDSQGNLYGTTQSGGNCEYCGTIFKVSPTSGTESVVYAFQGGSGDGAIPVAGLTLDPTGKYLYGTTYNGGSGNNALCDQLLSSGCGTVYKIDISGVTAREVWVYSFQGGSDGANPFAGVILDSTGQYLYGTTDIGCSGNQGTVYRIDTATGTAETVLHSFPSSAGDGVSPGASLTFDSGGNLYGTTLYGGNPACTFGISAGCGTVFRMDTSGNEAWVYQLGAAPDADIPTASLTLDATGTTLYSTTTNGGTAGYGTVFQISTSGTNEKVLYNFTGPDGQYPEGGLSIDKAGNLYGTTQYGGAPTSLYGVVFKEVNPKLPPAGAGKPFCMSSPTAATEPNRTPTPSSIRRETSMERQEPGGH